MVWTPLAVADLSAGADHRLQMSGEVRRAGMTLMGRYGQEDTRAAGQSRRGREHERAQGESWGLL